MVVKRVKWDAEKERKCHLERLGASGTSQRMWQVAGTRHTLYFRANPRRVTSGGGGAQSNSNGDSRRQQGRHDMRRGPPINQHPTQKAKRYPTLRKT